MHKLCHSEVARHHTLPMGLWHMEPAQGQLTLQLFRSIGHKVSAIFSLNGAMYTV